MASSYLSGKTFSNGGIAQLTQKKENTLYRDDYLLKLVQDKKILHVGFVDHLPLVDEKIKQKTWLHNKLIEASTTCFGVDINKEGIDYIVNNHDVEHLYALDITKDPIPSEIANTQFDYILIPDVIEHIGNPVAFLEALHERFEHNAKSIILTTPNAFRWNNFLNTFKNIEVINTDHRFWFTPYTLSKIVTDSGFSIRKLGYYEHGKLSKRQVLKKIILKKYVAFRDTLIIESNF